MKRIVHMTSVHSRGDTRIALKECKAVLRAGFECILIVADGKGDELANGVQVMDVGAATSRPSRMTKIALRVGKLAKALNAHAYHFHDPELIPVGLALRRTGKTVIYDVHEDVPADILSKPWIPAWQRRIVSASFGRFETHAIRKMSAVVTAWPYLREKFQTLNPQVVDIVNYAVDDELFIDVPWCSRPRDVCYVGGISNIRGIFELMTALESCDARLILGGDFHERETEERVRSMSAWNRVNYLGFLDRRGFAQAMARCRVGLVTFLPEPNHLNAMPNKLFEYMSAGLPVIASNFPRWREIVEGHRCGICVDPRDPREISQAILRLVSDSGEAEQMGANGRKAVLSTFNWSTEEQRLIDLYERLLEGGDAGAARVHELNRKEA
ncbi:MAG: hypothetical protein CMLOHMNK_01662 [Steroidobacteraceae bacterium]|nr:hypothetical protein [Steroidobacteraceae bacterium]